MQQSAGQKANVRVYVRAGIFERDWHGHEHSRLSDTIGQQHTSVGFKITG